MKRSKVKLWLFRVGLVVLVVILLELIGFFGLWINSRSADWLSNKNYFHIRAMLMGNKDADMLPRYLSLPYIGYIPYPGYKKNNVIQHNADGYRGARVPMLKTGKFRILCLGGSTTYGTGVALPEQTYPAQLEKMANAYIMSDSMLNKKYSGAEVINAGIEAGNSANELELYLFKYRYYHPDLVIVHSGVNDAMLILDRFAFELDYTHYRRINFHLEALPAPTCWFFRSYFFSYMAIKLFYDQFSIPNDEYKPLYHQTYCKWTEVNADSILQKKEYGYYPFYQNSQTLYREIIADGCSLLVFPNALNKNDGYVKSKPEYSTVCNLNAKLSGMLADSLGGKFVPFSFDSIKDADTWIDDCHLNAKGEEEKAQILLPAVVSIMNKKCRN